MFHPRMGYPKDDEAMGRILLPDLPMGKGITKPPSLIVDVRSNNPLQSIDGSPLSEGPRAVRIKKIPFQLSPQSIGTGLIALSSKCCLPHRGFLKPVFHLQRGLMKPLALEEEVFIKLINDLLQFLAVKELAELPHVFGLDIQDGMLAVKERNDEIGLRGQEEGLFTDILRVLKAEQGLALALNLEEIDISESGIIHELPQI